MLTRSLPTTSSPVSLAPLPLPPAMRTPMAMSQAPTRSPALTKPDLEVLHESLQLPQSVSSAPSRPAFEREVTDVSAQSSYSTNAKESPFFSSGLLSPCHRSKTPSHLTRTKGVVDFQPPSTGLGDYSGMYIRYGAREHALGAITNGLSEYGGVIPLVATFLACLLVYFSTVNKTNILCLELRLICRWRCQALRSQQPRGHLGRYTLLHGSW